MKTVAYFGDFIAIPIAVVIFAFLAISEGGLGTPTRFLISAALGALAWTLVEYLAHRFAYHRFPFLTRLHEAHHDQPLALLGFPSFVSSGIIIAVIFFPLRELSLVAACGVTSGMLVGYAIYMFVHHATHHFKIEPGDILYRARLRHLAHHYHDDGNFGVTVAVWDNIFGTAISRNERAWRL